MYVAINNKHEGYNWFIDFVKSLDPKADIRRYGVITYIESKKTLIRFIDFTTMQVACEHGRGFSVHLFNVIHNF